MNPGQIAQWANRLTPLIIVGCLAYYLYAFCYQYSWVYVREEQGSRGAAIVFIILFSVFVGLAIASWAQVLILGPGHTAKLDAVEITPAEKLPESFLCDPQGFRQWCSHCQSVKPDRAHHSSMLGRCVPKMDHYCAWLAALIGQRNLKLFVNTVFYFCIVAIYTIVSVLVYGHHSFPHTSALYVVMYIISGFWLLFLGGVLFMHVRFILGDWTTLEDMSRREQRMPIYNVECDGQRIVSRLRPEDLRPPRHLQSPYSCGSKWQNWKNIMGPTPLHWIIPLSIKSNFPADPQIKHTLVETLQARFRAGEEGYLAHYQPTTTTNHT